MGHKKVIDIYVHIGGIGDSGSGCRMSRQFIVSFAFTAMLVTLKVTPFEIGDEKIREVILQTIRNSDEVDYAVLLALDGVYKNGRYVESESHLVVPNDYVIRIAKMDSRVLLGASVHPYRRKEEMLREAKQSIDRGAVLFKWIPSSQQIDPLDERCFAFYELLAEKEVPLLCHTGPELAVPTSDPRAIRFNNPEKLKRALAMGVKVIAAHCATPYLGGILPADKDYFEKLIQMLKAASKKQWLLYADISAFCTPTRIAYLNQIKEEIAQGNIPGNRFLYGSDFPIPIIDINLFKKPLDLKELLQFSKERENSLDDPYKILREFGVPESIFTNARDILKLDR